MIVWSVGQAPSVALYDARNMDDIPPCGSRLPRMVPNLSFTWIFQGFEIFIKYSWTVKHDAPPFID